MSSDDYVAPPPSSHAKLVEFNLRKEGGGVNEFGHRQLYETNIFLSISFLLLEDFS